MSNPSKDVIPSVLLPIAVYLKTAQDEYVMKKDAAPHSPRSILQRKPGLKLNVKTPARLRKYLRVSNVRKPEHSIANRYAPPGRWGKNNDVEKTVLRSIVENSVRTCRSVLVPRFTLFCKVRAAQIRQGKAQSAGNGLSPCQGLQRRIGVFGRLPSGKPTSGHLRCCAHLH